ncbi:MAG TPA: phospholipase D-like domain-containing protein [Acidimicrobiales bacterium]|nr:phospholipase D-like domain-containing protein [Acidimicrobiales bacterium]
MIVLALVAAGCTSAAGTATSSSSSTSSSSTTGAAATSTLPAPTTSSPPPSTGGLSVEAEPSYGYSFVTSAIAGARHQVDLVMYELTDPSVEQALAAAAGRGVTVEVLLDSNLEQSANQAAFQYLSGHAVAVHWGPSGTTIHQKTLCIDQAVCYVMTGNLTPQYYSDTRDFTVIDTQASDISAVEATFAADFSGQPVATGRPGADLVWSPGSEQSLEGIIDSAATSLLVENEEMDSDAIVDALESAAQRGVQVHLVMTEDSEWDSAFDQLAAAGVKVSTYSQEAPLYIHAKAIVADGDEAFVGSENFSTASMEYNRELGVISRDPSVVAALSSQIDADFAGATPWS